MTELPDKSKIPDAATLGNIGSALLLLTHAAFIGASIGSLSLATNILSLETSTSKGVGILFSALGITLSTWTIRAIYITWQRAKLIPFPIFRNFDFITLMLIVTLLTLIAIYTLVIVCIR